MTKNKIQNIISNNISKYLTGKYRIINRSLIKYPVRDVMVGFCFENSTSENLVYIWWFAQPLYIPSDTLNLTFGNRISSKKDGQLWDLSSPKIESTIKMLLPELQLLENIELELLEVPLNFYRRYYQSKENNLRVYEAIACSASWLDLPNMNDEIENCLKFIKENLDNSIPWIIEVTANLNLLKGKKTMEDKLSLLNHWKKDTIANLKLNHDFLEKK